MEIVVLQIYSISILCESLFDSNEIVFKKNGKKQHTHMILAWIDKNNN